MKILYTAEALATGDGRNGHVRTADGTVDVALTRPAAIGNPGSGEGTNPENLFAAGYAACFHSALRRVAREENADVSNSAVGARVSLGSENNSPGFQLAVELEVTLPAVDDERARALIAKAHRVCPYSNATRGNIEVITTLSDG